MKILLSKENYGKDSHKFVYNYLLPGLKKLLSEPGEDDIYTLQLFSVIFNSDYVEAYKAAINGLKINETTTTYEIYFSNGIYDGMNYEDIINTITYGNRDIQGYKVVYNIFEWVAVNAPKIYEEWKRGTKIL